MQGQQNVQTPADGRTTGADEERARRAGAPGGPTKTAEVIRHRPKRRARGSQPAKISELHLHPTGPGCHKTQREILRCSGRCIVGWGDSHDNQFRLSIKPEEKTPGGGGRGGDLMDVAGVVVV